VSEFPVYQGICREISLIRALLVAQQHAEGRSLPELPEQIPYSTEQGVIFTEQGSALGKQGTLNTP
jgi:hypothetical protein